jgi:Dicarboxylate transport.
MSVHPQHQRGSRVWLVLGVAAAVLATACVAAVLLRTTIATAIVRSVLASQGIRSAVVVDSVDFGGAVAHGTLSQPGLEVTLGQVAVGFDPQHWLPHVKTVAITRPVVTIDLRAFKSQGGSGSLGTFGIDVSEARIIALTDAGRIEVTGNAHLIGGKPQAFAAELLPARLRSGALSADIKGGRLSGTATPSGMHVRLAVSGDVAAGPHMRLERTTFAIDVPALVWNDKLAAKAPSATIALTAAGRAPISVDARLSAVRIDTAQRQASAEVNATAKASLPPDMMQPVLGKLPMLAGDRKTTILTALQSLTAHARFAWSMAGAKQELRILESAEVKGGDALLLRVAPSTMNISGTALSGSFAMNLQAPGVPQLDLTVASFTAQPGQMDATLALKGRMSLGVLQDGAIDAQATARLRDGALNVTLQRCADVRLGGYAAKRGRMLTNTTAVLCPAADKPFVQVSSKGWTLQSNARSVRATLPAGALQISGGEAQISVSGTAAVPRDGTIRLSAMVSDAGKAQRFAPEKISGTVLIADATVHAKLALGAGPRAIPIGTISAVHDLHTGTGTAALDFPAVAFSPQGLQAAQISPMLAPLAQADGTAKFSGRVQWTAKRITSDGRLDVEALRFSSPLGVAQQLSTHMVFTSLIPPETAPNQRIAIERVDWVQPLTRTTTAVTLTPKQLRVAETRTELTGGEVSVSTVDVPLRDGATVHGTIRISRLALGKLIAASNLGEKLKLEGSVSGSLPFTFGPEGLRFANGHIEADGPGKLSINHTLWGKGETNSVEKAAYQALENLSYQSLAASLESVPGGRLRAVFHVVGYDDGPGTPHAEFSLTDLLTGKAFQKEIPIPRGTAINLTLDSSLNFDELLRGYQATWSQMKAQNGAPP